MRHALRSGLAWLPSHAGLLANEHRIDDAVNPESRLRKATPHCPWLYL